jgi:hypothetical protein
VQWMGGYPPPSGVVTDKGRPCPSSDKLRQMAV